MFGKQPIDGDARFSLEVDKLVILQDVAAFVSSRYALQPCKLFQVSGADGKFRRKALPIKLRQKREVSRLNARRETFTLLKRLKAVEMVYQGKTQFPVSSLFNFQ